MSSPAGSTTRSPGSRRRSELNSAPGTPSTPRAQGAAPPSSPLRRTSRPSTSQYATSPRSPAAAAATATATTETTPSRLRRGRASEVDGSAAAAAVGATSSPRQAPRTSSSQPPSQAATPREPAASSTSRTPSASATGGTTRRTPGGSQAAKAKDALERDRLERQIREVDSEVQRLDEQVRDKREALLQGDMVWDVEGARLSGVEQAGGDELEDMVKGMDDEALIALLTAPRSALASALPPGAAPDTVAPPPISAGIEGLGSSHTLDVVLTELRNGVRSSLAQGAAGGKRKRRRTTSGGKGRAAGQDDDGPGQTEDESAREDGGGDDEVDNVRGLLMARQERLERLLAQLSAFTGMSLSETSNVELRGRAGRRKTIQGVLSIPAGLELAPDGIAFEVTFDVVEDAKGDSQPRIERLSLDVDEPLREALDKDFWLTSALSEGNLPGILQALRSLPPLALSRRSLFSSLARSYPKLCADYMERLGEQGALPGQDSPAKRGRTSRGGREAHERSLDTFVPERAEALRFVNDRGAELRLSFAIDFNPFGHASPRISVSASLPRGAGASQAAQDLVEGLPERFAKLLAHAAGDDVEEDDGIDASARRKGLQTESAVRATVEAFFGLS